LRACERETQEPETSARKGYIRSIIGAVDVDDGAIRIIGSKDPASRDCGKQIDNGNVRGFYANGGGRLFLCLFDLLFQMPVFMIMYKLA
jgi:hypothetical protein